MIRPQDGELEDIEIRYAVEATFEVKTDDGLHGCADASFSITCGVYSGIPDRDNMASLINSRTLDVDDIDIAIGDFDAEEIVDIVEKRGVRGSEIRSMTIEEVLHRDRPIAHNVRPIPHATHGDDR